MQRTVSHCIGRSKFPAGQMRLHDFEARRDPVDRIEQVVKVRTGFRRGLHPEHRFRLVVGMLLLLLGVSFLTGFSGA